LGGEYFCGRCIKIQPAPSQLDYFQRFGLPRHLTINLQDLERRFHDLSRKFHPDLFQGKSDQEQAISLENSALLNKAYRTLRDPILRVEYLIRLEEGAVKDIPAKAPTDLLEEILELQETLEEYRLVLKESPEKSGGLHKKLLRDQEQVASRKAALKRDLLGLFDEWDRLQDQSIPTSVELQKKQRQLLLQKMRDLLSAQAYLKAVLEDLDEELRAHP
jgi:molecular chaperone HscB